MSQVRKRSVELHKFHQDKVNKKKTTIADMKKHSNFSTNAHFMLIFLRSFSIARWKPISRSHRCPCASKGRRKRDRRGRNTTKIYCQSEIISVKKEKFTVWSRLKPTQPTIYTMRFGKKNSRDMLAKNKNKNRKTKTGTSRMKYMCAREILKIFLLRCSTQVRAISEERRILIQFHRQQPPSSSRESPLTANKP